MIYEPIDTWPGVLTPAHKRRGNPFRYDRVETMTALRYELERISAEAVVIRLALTEDDFKLDRRPRAGARPEHPGVVVEYDHPLLKRRLRHATDAYATVTANLRAISLTLKALRDIDRHGTTSRGEQYAGFQKLLTTGESSMNMAEAQQFIDRHGGYKAAVKMLHPDSGGNEEAFKKLQRAAVILGLDKPEEKR